MFSVVIPVYNHAVFLREAVCSALQSPLVAEVLLLDDGSTDGSRELSAELVAGNTRIRDLTPSAGGNRGAHQRLNELTEAARCDWIAVLNSDDAFVQGRFEAVIDDPLFSHSDFIFGNLQFKNQHDELVGAKRGPFDTEAPFPALFDVAALVGEKRFLELLAHQNFVGSTSNMIFRKSLHARIGGFREYRYVHDWDFALRAAAVGCPLYVQGYLTVYRLHAKNTISENSARVNREARDLFRHFALDFPEQSSTAGFRAAVEANAYLSAPVDADRGNDLETFRENRRSLMRGSSVEIGICGTFDVANYGDLLFPLIAEAELRDRLGAVTLFRFSYHGKTTAEWPFEVTSINMLPQMMRRLNGLLIGGGHLIRFDKNVAPGYGPPTSEIHHPTGYWLTPALIALQRGVPLMWNAPSVGDDIPKWAHPLMVGAG